VTCVDKSNVFRSYAFFRKIFTERAAKFPDISPTYQYIDAMALDLVRRPWEYDVLVAENMFADVLSDLGGGIIGGMGMAPTGEIGDNHALFQPAHGSAPDIAGTGKANPTAMFLSAAMMMDWLGQRPETQLLDIGPVCGENIEFFGGVYGLGRNVLSDKRDKLLDELKLTTTANRLTQDLPLGFKQRLALGCALLHDPKIIFLDEPTGGVDPEARRQFWDLIYELADNGKTVFVTTHYMDEAEYCNRISIMYQGEIIALDTPAKMKKTHNKTSMQDVFIHLVDK